MHLALPHNNISAVQLDLLRSAPFPLNKHYKDLIDDFHFKSGQQ